MSHQPPKLLVKWLARLFREDLVESIEGDLYELFLIDADRKGLKTARKNYFWNTIAFLRHHRLQKVSKSKTQNNMSLFKNYLKVSWRGLIRNKTFTSINLIGLVSGMTIFLLILQYVLFEHSYDTFHKDADQIFRVVNDRYQNGSSVQRGTITYPTIGQLMEDDFPEVKAHTRMTVSGRNYLKFDNETRLVNRLLYADEHFLSFFDFPLVTGTKNSALDAPFEVVLTESFAKSLSDDPAELTGKLIHFGDRSCQITGVVEDPPANSHLQFEMLVSYKSFIEMAGEGADKSMSWSDFYHYVKLEEGINANHMQGKLVEFGLRHFKDGEVSGAVEKFELQPLLEARMDNSLEYEIGEVTNGKIVWLMMATGLFILVIGWINYINLNTSRAIQRAKEVGIRKSIGCSKTQLVRQFILETALINTLALTLSVLLTLLIQPYFNQLTGLDLGIGILFTTFIFGIPSWLVLLISMVFSVVVVGVYPSVITSSFRTNEALKGSPKMKGEIAWLRKGLVVFQFSIAVILITAVLSVNRQIDFMLNKELGIDIKQNLVVYGPASFNWDSTLVTSIDRFKNDLASISGVERVTATSRMAGSRMGRVFHIKSPKKPDVDNLTSNFINSDHAYAEVFGLKILAGRDLEITDHNADGDLVKNILINETAVKLLGYQEPMDVVNQKVHFFGQDWTIVGVINDFHQMSLHQPIESLFILPYYQNQQSFALKLSGNAEPLLPQVREVFMQHFPGDYFDYYFLEDQYQKNYQAEFRLAEISKVFTFLSILIAGLGLYGLVMITLLNKTKEIGIRKVLGASLGQLLYEVNKEFTWLIVIAAVIGAPVAYYGIQKWQNGFAYSVEIGVDVLFLASISLLIICVLTIGLHVGRVMRNNPVNSLRNE